MKLTIEDRMLGITGPLTEQQEADIRTYGDALAKRLKETGQTLSPKVCSVTTDDWLSLL